MSSQCPTPNGFSIWRPRPAALLMPLAGRCMIVVQMALLPYARPGGLGSVFYQQGHRLSAVWAVVVLTVAGFMLQRISGLVIAGACLAGQAPFLPPSQLQQHLLRLLDEGLDPLEEVDRLAAVDEAVVVGEREVHHRAHHDLPVLDHRAVDDVVHA